jgi:ribosomal protein S18 acetylase RimI-like enzyme
MVFSIRPYAPDDFDGVDILWREAFPDDGARDMAAVAIPQKLKVQGELFLVAVDEMAVIGSIMAGYDGHRGWIYRVAVLESHRSRGIGRALIEEAERQLIALGCPKVKLQILPSNAGVTAFYRKLGYETEQRINMGKALK